jgi:CheY-like chemotaxis protein
MRDELFTPVVETRPASRTAPTRARVLVVDDEPAILRVIQRVLDDHDVVTAPDAASAMAILSTTGPFDVVLCDVVMPGMSGIEFWSEMVLTNPTVAERIVFMTGGAPAPGDEKFLASGAVEVLRKPFSFDRMRDIVDRWAASARAE